MKKKPPHPHVMFDKLEINVINESSGIFMDGPHSANYWRSHRKETTGWGHINGGSLNRVYSIVKDNDNIDFFNSESAGPEKNKDKS